MNLVNYQQIGSGPNIVLIHGLFGSLENLNMIAKSLAPQYRVTSIDVRNHGKSFHENNMDYANLAQDIINLLNFLQIAKSHILGHSMGGKIAMQLALDFPERVNKLIVADIAPVTYSSHHTEIFKGLKSIDFTKIKQRKEADSQLAKFVDEIAVRQFLLKNLATADGQLHFKCNLDFISACYEKILQGYQGSKQFTGATLFIKGANSDYILAEHKEIINKILPTSKVKIIQGAGHWLHAEKSIAFNKITHDFLAS